MEKNAELVCEDNTTKDYSLDMEHFLRYLMMYKWDCDAFVVYHPNKDVANQFLRFIGTFFPQIKDRKEVVIDNLEQFNSLSVNVGHELLNYGEAHYYRRNVSNGSASVKRLLWVNLISIEGYSKKIFKDISFWKTYGRLVREYGKNHF